MKRYREKSNRLHQFWQMTGALVCACACIWLVTSCADEPLADCRTPLRVEEGIEGELTLRIGNGDFELRTSAQTRANDQDAEADEQHIHSVYLFVVKKGETEGAARRIVARKYFPDVTGMVKPVTVDGRTWQVIELSMKAVSCNDAEIFALANVGYSGLQHVSNDADLLKACDESTTLEELLEQKAQMNVTEQGEVRIERTQGHLLMSGYFVGNDHTHYLSGTEQLLTLKAEANGTISIWDATTRVPFNKFGGEGGNPGAVILQRLDAKVTFKVLPVGELAETEGAYFQLTSWQVKNVPVTEVLCWHDAEPQYEVKDSKVFQRDISQMEGGGYTFNFYQFENFAQRDEVVAKNGYNPIDEQSIVEQYNLQHRTEDITAADLTAAMSEGYPNDYTKFAYGLRTQREKSKEDGTPYEGEASDDDQTINVTNGDFQFAPNTATYVLLKGNYYNPAEPVRRRADDPRNEQFPDMSLEAYPYWNVQNQPVQSVDEAAKRTRTAQVAYTVHLGYVGGGNFHRTTEVVPTENLTLHDYLEKVNDYNVLRNHHYTYTIGISGVDNIKVEATREDGGNVWEQEKQPGGEGLVIESQHLYSLDAHYETRNLTIDFERMPEGIDHFHFRLWTPYEADLNALLKRKENGTYGIFTNDGDKEITDIRGYDLDWIHFAWHGTPDDPSRSLIDEQTGNGIAYSDTYGGYITQQTYDDPDGKLRQEQDATHTHYLMNSCEFVMQVWDLYQQWIAKGRPQAEKTVTYTLYVDEYYYDHNPKTGESVDWTSFCSKPSRTAFYFQEEAETSADGNSQYADAHIVITQQSIQTPYATSTAGGQVVADVAFGIENKDEFDCKYNNSTNVDEQYLAGVRTSTNGLYGTMRWYYQNQANDTKIISWEKAETYFNEKERARILKPNDNASCSHDDGHRTNRRAAWSVYSRNRDLNRDGALQADEVRWFVPTVDQYIICFLGGRSAFNHPIYEMENSHRVSQGPADYLWNLPFQHYLSCSGHIFWAEEGCSISGYGGGGSQTYRTIRMGRMLTVHGIDDSGAAIPSADFSAANALRHDPVFIISETRNGQAITDYNTITDGKNYYVTLNKLTPSALRDYVYENDLSQHDHEQKNNWLYREFKIARNKIGYTSYTDKDNYNRIPKINGVSRTWWQLNGIWTPDKFKNDNDFAYYGPTASIANAYTEQADGSDLHRWRVPNLREAAVMSLVFPGTWFNGAITCRTRSANLGPRSTNVPYFLINAKIINRIGSLNLRDKAYIRPVHDVRAGD